MSREARKIAAIEAQFRRLERQRGGLPSPAGTAAGDKGGTPTPTPTGRARRQTTASATAESKGAATTEKVKNRSRARVPGSSKGSSTPSGSKSGGRKGSGAKGTPKATGGQGPKHHLGDGKLDFSRAWRGKAQKLTMQQVPFARHVEAMAAVVKALPHQERGLLKTWNRLVQSPKITNYNVIVPDGVPAPPSKYASKKGFFLKKAASQPKKPRRPPSPTEELISDSDEEGEPTPLLGTAGAGGTKIKVEGGIMVVDERSGVATSSGAAPPALQPRSSTVDGSVDTGSSFAVKMEVGGGPNAAPRASYSSAASAAATEALRASGMLLADGDAGSGMDVRRGAASIVGGNVLEADGTAVDANGGLLQTEARNARAVAGGEEASLDGFAGFDGTSTDPRGVPGSPMTAGTAEGLDVDSPAVAAPAAPVATEPKKRKRKMSVADYMKQKKIKAEKEAAEVAAAAEVKAEADRIAAEEAAAAEVKRQEVEAAAAVIAAEKAAADKLVAEKAAAEKASKERVAAARKAAADRESKDRNALADQGTSSSSSSRRGSLSSSQGKGKEDAGAWHRWQRALTEFEREAGSSKAMPSWAKR